ncbi:hypothetical protein ASG63_07705 [Methylobacterium sp. Leaf94]|jgi:hypothetical protein|uniref:DUF1476 domain-containing protein n=1 Tax=Methylobacterium sp. Leaf94 TaxID=1736250 RepID=UPI000701955B|nr:DUF1476 domain-containing protein [Methylobacterium sp. Leaf94]KQU19027.1 hypothetical protein ASG63_07705 [Methylobacterium sp. Leaf94]
MNTTFDERERAFESRFAHEEELRFQARVRRNRLLATWAAERMHLTGDAASAYVTSFAEEAVVSDDDALLARLRADLRACGIDEPLANLRREMERCIAFVRAEQRVGLALDQGSSA